MKRLPPPVYVLVAAGLQRLLSPGRRITTGSALTALPVGAASVGVAVSTFRGFARAGTTIDPIEVDAASALVESGPNRFTRNPIYLAMAGVLLAHAIARRSWWALLPVAGFVAVIDRTQIRAEEEALRERFGEAYAAYARRVPRWVGPVRSGAAG